ncbi:MAG: plasmid maintenance system killer family protein [Alphaproteobacteria bacterium]|nr:plasmid maintenance system killer family protein [Alphaproteobacteria bacterium]
MIRSFNSKETEKIWGGSRSVKFPAQIQEIARRKQRMLNNSIDLKDLSIPPSNRLEKLKGEKKDLYSIRVTDQWRITFKWIDGHSYDVEIVDYH